MKKERWVLAQPLYAPLGNERQFLGWIPSDRPLNGEENPGSLNHVISNEHVHEHLLLAGTLFSSFDP